MKSWAIIVYTRQWDATGKRIGWIASVDGYEAFGKTRKLALLKLYDAKAAGRDAERRDSHDIWSLECQSFQRGLSDKTPDQAWAEHQQRLRDIEAKTGRSEEHRILKQNGIL